MTFTKDKNIIKNFFGQLKERKCIFTEEGDVHFGIKIKHQKDGSMRLSKTCLIRRIIETIPGMTSTNSRETPSMPTVNLSKDADEKTSK